MTSVFGKPAHQYRQVYQSKNVSVLGLSGIVILDTENTFSIVTRQNKVKSMRIDWYLLTLRAHGSPAIPKQNSVFMLTVPLYQTSKSMPASDAQASQNVTDYPDPQTVNDIPHMEFKLYGNQFRFRSADRASRKFKHKETIEL